jgi:hypothetical protein
MRFAAKYVPGGKEGRRRTDGGSSGLSKHLAGHTPQGVGHFGPLDLPVRVAIRIGSRDHGKSC